MIEFRAGRDDLDVANWNYMCGSAHQSYCVFFLTDISVNVISHVLRCVEQNIKIISTQFGLQCSDTKRVSHSMFQLSIDEVSIQ